MREADSVNASTGRDFAAGFELIVASIDSLPTLPAILWEIQAALQNPRSGSAEISMVIEQDQSLTANILRLANSAYFGSSDRYVSITEAVTRIGLREIENLVSATLVVELFSELGEAMDETDFCCHNLQVAEAASFLTERNLVNRMVNKPFDPKETAIEDLMVRKVVTVPAHATVAYAIHQMSSGGYRHLPIVDPEHRPVGIVSVRDIVDYLAVLFPHKILTQPPDAQKIPPTREGG